MDQLSLFDKPQAPAERPPPNLHNIRRYLNSALRIMRAADFMPWHAAEAAGWEKDFPTFARLLPADEATAMVEEFENQMTRLKATK